MSLVSQPLGSIPLTSLHTKGTEPVKTDASAASKNQTSALQKGPYKPLDSYTAQQLYNHNHLHHAIRAYTELLSTQPSDNYELLNKRGIIKAGLKDYLGAFLDYTSAIQINPYFFKPYVNRGNMWVFLGNLAAKANNPMEATRHYQQALTDYQRAITLSPFSSITYENRGELYASLGRTQEALNDKAMALNLEFHKKTDNASKSIDCRPRIALVLANDDYPNEKNDLNGGATKDAVAVAENLKKDGFQLVTGNNMNGIQTRMLVDEFVHRIHNNPHAVSLVYYSGHGGSVDNNNYFLPTDFTGKVNAQFLNTAVSVDYLLDKLKMAPSDFNIVILDACRTPLQANALHRNPEEGRTHPLELRPGASASNTWVEYATSQAKHALQKNNQGLFTKYFLHYMNQPGLSLKQVSLLTSYQLASDPEANRYGQFSSTETNLSETDPLASGFHFNPAKPCPS